MPEETHANEVQIEKTSAGFSPITTQEEFDKAVKARLERAERRFREDNKETFEKAKAYDERIEQEKTELEKEKDRADKAEAELAEFKKSEEIASWKQEISKETGVPANVLRGNTKEELKEHAESLKDAYGDSRKPFVQSGGFASTTPSKTTRDLFADAVTDFLGE